jgi:hypothetical protein
MSFVSDERAKCVKYSNLIFMLSIAGTGVSVIQLIFKTELYRSVMCRGIQHAKYRGTLYKKQTEVFYKATTSAVLHCLRNGWRDKQTVFTEDIPLFYGDEDLIICPCIFLLLQVNDENVEHMSTAEVIDLLRKIRGTIGITVLRKSGTDLQVS